MNSSNQEKRGLVRLRLGRVNPKSTTLRFQTMKTNTVGRREFHFWKPKESSLHRETRRHQSHVKLSQPTLPPLKTTIIMTRFPRSTPQMSVKITYDLKAVMWSLPILKSQERAQVSLCHTKHQMTLYWTCHCPYRLTTVWWKLQVPKRRATLFWKKAPRLPSYQQLTSNTCPQQVCLPAPCISPKGHMLLLSDFPAQFWIYISTNCHYSDTEREPPRPKPRQRTLGLSHHAAEKIAEDAESQDLSRPQTSSASIPLSTDMSSNIAVRSCGPHAGIIAWLFSIFELKHLIVACLLCRFTEVDRRRSRSFMQPQQILFK